MSPPHSPLPAAAPPALVAVDLSRRYGRMWAVRRVSHAFAPGAVTALLGDNGAGKSTLLALLAGLLRPDDGHVEILGEPVVGFPPEHLRRSIALLAHAPFVYPDLTGRENLAFFAALHQRPLLTSERGVPLLLTRVGLAEAADRRVRTYSRGMVQRLALARILLEDAPIWLLDEPTTGLDQHGLALLRALLADAAAAGRTIVAVTHDLGALGPVTASLRLSRGRIVAEPPASSAPSTATAP